MLRISRRMEAGRGWSLNVYAGGLRWHLYHRGGVDDRRTLFLHHRQKKNGFSDSAEKIPHFIALHVERTEKLFISFIEFFKGISWCFSSFSSESFKSWTPNVVFCGIILICGGQCLWISTRIMIVIGI